MIIIDKNDGRKIDYTTDGTVIVFGENELTLNLAEIQDDWDIRITICYDKRHQLTTENGGITYVAEIDIPTREWIESEGSEEEESSSTRAPLDMENVTLTLWAVDDAVYEEE